MAESFKEQLFRVQSMAKDDGSTWDLSENDQAALQAMLDALNELMLREHGANG